MTGFDEIVTESDMHPAHMSTHVDPIDRPDFNPKKKREPNPVTLATLRARSDAWRDL